MLGAVNKHFVLKNLLTAPSNVLPLQLKQNYSPIIQIFTEGEGDGIQSKLLFKIISNLKVENILKGTTVSISSPSPPVKIQIMGGKVCLRCKGKTLLGIVNKLLKTKSLLASPTKILPLHLKQTFPPII